MSLKVLAVDDSRTIRDMLKLTLEHAGMELYLAEDGVHGLEVLDGLAPDAIISDINMPRLDGFGFIEAVRGQDRHRATPILVLTTESDDPSKEVRQTTIDVRGMADVELAKVLATIADREEVIDIDHAPGNGS